MRRTAGFHSSMILSLFIGSVSAQFCLPEVLCLGGVCNTNATVVCTDNSTAVAECPCQCNAQCPDPADDGVYCSMRDCWAGVCMNMTIGELVRDTFDTCTTSECLNNATAMTYVCDTSEHTFGCCQQAEDDCYPPKWSESGPCMQPICYSFNLTIGSGLCALAPEPGRC